MRRSGAMLRTAGQERYLSAVASARRGGIGNQSGLLSRYPELLQMVESSPHHVLVLYHAGAPVPLRTKQRLSSPRVVIGLSSAVPSPINQQRLPPRVILGASRPGHLPGELLNSRGFGIYPQPSPLEKTLRPGSSCCVRRRKLRHLRRFGAYPVLSPVEETLRPITLPIFTSCAAAVDWPAMGRTAEDYRGEEETEWRSLTPLSVPRVTDLKQFDGAHRERLFWGTYRPFAYLGIKSRAPESLIAGLMWGGVQDGKDVLRHYCHDSDNLTKWSWLRHDGSTYGRQVLVDQGLVVTTYFLKSTEEGSAYGGDWVVRVRVEEEEDALPTKPGEARTQSVFYYVAESEASGRVVNLWPKQNTYAEDVPFAGGSAKEVGDWHLHAKYEKGVTMHYAGLHQRSMANLSQHVLETLEKQKEATGLLQLPNSLELISNVAVIQLTGTLPFETDLVFLSGVNKESDRAHARLDNLTGLALQKKLAKRELAFEERFQETFQLREKVKGEMELETARVALSNMLGGIGYFEGRTRVAVPFKNQDPGRTEPDFREYWNASLYTAVPSRSIFPRGFLWDEGFHQLLISRWDRQISLEIIGNWLDLVNVDGWIPREQILGEEALSKVPALYVNQHTDNANPPALLLVLRGFAKRFESDKRKGVATADDLDYFKAIFPRLEVWYSWFLNTQTGKESDTYYWHGRDEDLEEELNPKTLTSGLDDYPRASHPTDDERHVDLRCWLANAADSMALLARIIGEPCEKYEKISRELSNLTRLNELHYDDTTGHYYDYGYHTEKVELRWQDIEDPSTGLAKRVLQRVVLEAPKLGWVPHFGLNSLFPFLFGLIPQDSPILGNHLEMLRNPELLWTDFGLRSLATTSSIYMKYNTEFEAPYWRGPVWINVNYLVLSALHAYAQGGGPYCQKATKLYHDFRENLIRNIVQRFHETGYIFENYDNASMGKGQGAHPFTGWSALIVLIMGEMY